MRSSMRNLVKHISESLSDVNEGSIYVAVSGGLDSMVLLNILVAKGISPTVLHVNYNLRGEESDADQKFIEDHCNTNELELMVKNTDLAQILKDQGGNLQETARNVRYHWFEEIISSNPEAVILLAHHLDDQIETFFLQLFRGSGMLGLAGMSKIRKYFRRPLLDFTRKEIENYARENSVSWREDSSNRSLKYSRNKLRNEFIPFTESHNARIKEDIAYLVSVFQENYNAIQNHTRKTTDRLLENNYIGISELRSLNEEEINELLRQLGLPIQLRTEILKLTDSENNKRITLDHPRFSALVRSNHLIRIIAVDEEVLTANLKVESVQHLPDLFDKNSIYLDADKLHGELKLREWRESDRMAPIGVPGTQLISKILHDQKVSTEERSRFKILSDDKHILWCPGYKIGRIALANENTATILKCSVTYTKSAE